MNNEYLRPGQAARELNVAVGTLQNWRYQGIGPKFIKHRRSIFYAVKDILEYKEANFRTFGSTTEWKEETLKKR